MDERQEFQLLPEREAARECEITGLVVAPDSGGLLISGHRYEECWMEFRTLGRTGLKVSVLGLGGGGPSRLGQRGGQDEADSIAVVRQALEAGVNFIDTAEAYGTEEIVGKAIVGFERDSLVISTKKSTWGGSITPEDVEKSLADSLERLGTDYVDLYHLHGVALKDYDYLFNEIVPVLQDCQDRGQILHIGITEAWNSDTTHATLERALQNDVWDVMMVGFNLLNQSAREHVFAHTIEQNVGTLIMFAVRNALSKPDQLKETIHKLVDEGYLESDEIDMENPLGFLLEDGIAESLTDAAYRFCLYEPGAHVILSGTGNPEHLRQNIATMQRPPLPEHVVIRLREIFAGINHLTGQ